MNKSYILILVVLVIIAGAIIWLRPAEEPIADEEETEEVKNGTAGFLEIVRTELDMGFTETEETELKWFVEGEEGIETFILQAKSIEVKGVLNEVEDQVNTYFKDNGFEENEFNISAGTIGWATGYQKDNLVCSVAVGLWLNKDEIPFETGERDITITCSDIEGVELPEISKEKEIKKLFAEVYEKKVSAIELTIGQEADHHVRGGVKFLDEEEPGNAGLFLATDINGEWELAFDGNGAISCSDLDEFAFPEDMIEDCN